MLKKPCDLRQEDLVRFRPDPRTIREEAAAAFEEEWHFEKAQAARQIAVETGAALCAGDLAEIEIKLLDELPAEKAFRRFRRTTQTVELGKGFFAEALEKQLIGATVGSEKIYSFEYRALPLRLDLRICAARRIDMPSDEELFRARRAEQPDFGDGFSSFDAFRAAKIASYTDIFCEQAFLQKAMQPLSRLLFSASDLNLAPEEIRRHREQIESSLRESENEGMSRLELCRPLFGESVTSEEELDARLNEHAEAMAVLNTYARELLKEEKGLPEAADYDAFVRDNLDLSGLDEAEFRRRYDENSFVTGLAQEHLSLSFLTLFRQGKTPPEK